MFKKYSEKDLEKMIEVEGGKGFAPAFLAGVKATLTANPKLYRQYGLYWWPLKLLLIESGFDLFGSEIDEYTALSLSYSTDELTCAACYTYAEREFLMGNMYSNSHIVNLNNGDDDTYYINDNEIEGVLFVDDMIKGGLNV